MASKIQILEVALQVRPHLAPILEGVITSVGRPHVIGSDLEVTWKVFKLVRNWKLVGSAFEVGWK